jgi:hypothetical protein
MLSEEIRNNWSTDIIGYAQSIKSLENGAYPAWSVKFEDSYGVAIPIDDDVVLNESFAGARIKTMIIHISSENTQNAIVLLSNSQSIAIPFSTLCEALINPGENGELRKMISRSPLAWWKEWKELLGNRNIDERIYDVLGELCVFKYVIQHGEEAEWNGPDGATYDIETVNRFLEVKSSISREKREVTISSQFQLFPPDKPLALVFCCFEPVMMSGISIDGLLNEFQTMGYNTDLLNQKLEKRGFEKGMSARKKSFLVHEILLYKVDQDFPTVTPSSFIGGVLPAGITKISYTVDLSGLTPTPLYQGE